MGVAVGVVSVEVRRDASRLPSFPLSPSLPSAQIQTYLMISLSLSQRFKRALKRRCGKVVKVRGGLVVGPARVGQLARPPRPSHVTAESNQLIPDPPETTLQLTPDLV